MSSPSALNDVVSVKNLPILFRTTVFNGPIGIVCECRNEMRRWSRARFKEMSLFRSSFRITRAGATHRDAIIVHARRLDRRTTSRIDAFSNLAAFSVVTAANFHPQQ